jgi:hypothetical protein
MGRSVLYRFIPVANGSPFHPFPNSAIALGSLPG